MYHRHTRIHTNTVHLDYLTFLGAAWFWLWNPIVNSCRAQNTNLHTPHHENTLSTIQMEKAGNVGGFSAGLNVHLPKNIIFMNSNHILTGLNNIWHVLCWFEIKKSDKEMTEHEGVMRQQNRKCNQWKIWMAQPQKLGSRTHARAHTHHLYQWYGAFP